jgi:hypothetical protein
MTHGLPGSPNNSDLPQTGAHDGVRWQFLVDDVDEVASVCAAAYLRLGMRHLGRTGAYYNASVELYEQLKSDWPG